MSRRPDPTAWARARAAQLLIRSPELVRGATLELLAERELSRRIDRNKRVGAQIAQRYLASSNSTAARVALRSATERAGSPLTVEQVVERAGARPSDTPLQLAAAAYLAERAPLEAGAILERVADTGIDSSVAVLFVRVAFQAEDADDFDRIVVRGLEAADDDDARTLLTAARDIGTQFRAGRTLSELAATHRDDPRLLAALCGWAENESSVSELRALADVVVAVEGVDVEAALALGRQLRSVGDFSSSTRIAEQILATRPGKTRARALATAGRSVLTTLDDGWHPPARSSRGDAPTSGPIPYLLHSALPHVSVGYATRTHGLLTALRADDWDVQGVTRPGFPLDVAGDVEVDAVDVVDGVPYHHLLDGKKTFPLFPVERTVRAFTDILAPFVADRGVPLIHAASNYRNGAAGIAVARELGVPSVYEVRGLWEYTRLARQPDYAQTEHHDVTVLMETTVAREADHVIAITGALKDVLVERGVDAERITVVPNGVDTSRFRPQERDDALAASLGLAGKTVIGYVGSLLEYEGLDLLVEAAAELRTRRSDFAVLVVGDGRSLPELQARAVELGVDDIVVFPGRVPHDEVERYYSIIDVAPFPRLPVAVCELVSPLKPFEAMAMGKLVVASDVAALAEIIDDGDNGYLFTKGSAGSLAEVLAGTLDDEAARRTVAGQGLDWVRDVRDWSAVARSVASVYEALGVTRR